MKKNNMPRLRELRGERSKREFAMKLGISYTAYSRYESGERYPDWDSMLKICTTLGVSADWLLGLSDIRIPGASSTSPGVHAGQPATASPAISCPTCAHLAREISDLKTANAQMLEIIANLAKKEPAHATHSASSAAKPA